MKLQLTDTNATGLPLHRDNRSTSIVEALAVTGLIRIRESATGVGTLFASASHAHGARAGLELGRRSRVDCAGRVGTSVQSVLVCFGQVDVFEDVDFTSVRPVITYGPVCYKKS